MSGNVKLSAENKVKSERGQLDYFANTPAAANTEKGYNEEKFVKTQMCKDMMSALYNYFEYTDANTDSEAIDRFWMAKGVKRYCYNMDDPERAWTAYMPSGLYFNPEEGYKYPVVFVVHGGNNTILMTESYGWSELCASKGFIAVIPWAQKYGGGSLMLSEIPRILDILKGSFPIDESRIYAAGFSAGGRNAINLLVAYPQLFAAGAIQPTSLFGFAEEAEVSDTGMKSCFSYADFERVRSYQLPLIIYGGSYESCFPISLDYPRARKVPSADLTRYVQMTGAIFPEITDEGRKKTAALSGNIASRLTGFEFDPANTRILERQGTYCVLGDYLSPEGVPVFRCNVVQGMPHWPLLCEAEQNWEFFTLFSRDPESGKLIF